MKSIERINHNINQLVTTKNLVFLTFVSILCTLSFVSVHYLLLNTASMAMKSAYAGFSILVALYFCFLILSRDEYQKDLYDLEEYNEECLERLEQFEELSQKQAQKIQNTESMLYKLHIKYDIHLSELGLKA